MYLQKNKVVALLLCSIVASRDVTNAFTTSVGSSQNSQRLAQRTTISTTTTTSTELLSTKDDAAVQEAKELLERAKKMRVEIAALEGKTVDDVEKEAKMKKEIAMKAAAEREEMALKRSSSSSTSIHDGKGKRQSSSSRQTILTVPETADDQIRQATSAVERAFRDGITRQVVRFALIPDGELLNEDRQWPGGAQQMYREAAGPLTRNLLKDIRAPTDENKDDPNTRITFSSNNVTSQDIWDFDGTALISAQSPSGPNGDVQALVLPNTDNKYTNDIKTIDAEMGDRLFLLINPFWRNLESWGINILAPNAKKLAQEAIFDRGFEETYVLLQKSVRGEDCIALKAYPYDWQLYAYIETDYWPYQEYLTHLGSTKEEPTAKDFAEILEKRDEFKLNKTMRRIDRMSNRN